MDDDERLREALLELETLRAREAERLHETQALLSALEALASSPEVEAGLAALLSSITASLGCTGVALFEAAGDRLSLRLPTPPAPVPDWEAPGLLSRPRRIVDLHGVRGPWGTPPEAMAEWRALLSVPLEAGDQRLVLAAHADAPGRFTARDAELLVRLAPIAGQAILRRALERRNAFLASVIDRSPSSVAIAEATGDLPLVYVNDAFTELSGYSRAEVLGRNCRVMSAEPEGAPVRREIREALAARRDGTFVLRNRRRDGTLFWNQLRLFPVEGEDGAATHVVASQTDVTARIKAEAERDQARRRMAGALEATSEAFLILGRDGHVRYANASFADIAAPDRPERDALLPRALAARLLDRTEADLPDRIIAAFAEPLGHEIVARDGRQLLLRARPIPDGGAVVSVSDVTQVKVNERALRQRLAAIERSQDGIAIGDAEGRVFDLNPALVALWGLAGEDAALGRRWTAFYDPASLEAFREGEATPRAGAYRAEAEIELSGGRRTHEVSLSLVPDVGSILVVRDVTDRLRDDAARDEMRLALDRAQAQARLHQVSAGLAHDFNNLLSAILGSAALLEATDLPDPARAATGRIQAAAGRAAELTQGLLDLGAREKTTEPVDLARILRSTVDLARAGAPSTARISLDLPERPLTVEASRTDLLQVVMNLVVNAADALGGAPGAVRVTLAPPGPAPAGRTFAVGTPEAGRDYAAIAVEDTGEGMSQETVARVLEPYFTTKGNVGTGLGLAIVATIVAEAGGLLSIDSERGRGTRMTVLWPVGARPEPGPARGLPRDGARAHLPVLVLDDVAEVAASHAATLARAGFEVAELDDPALALEAVAEDPDGWGCLVSDYDMPGLTGGDLIERLEDLAPGLPVVVVSALARRLTDRRLARAGAVLQKPLSADRLVAAVRDATGARRVEGT
jgi:PAS domain S-box-containing protein